MSDTPRSEHDQCRAPYADALHTYTTTATSRLAVPGHHADPHHGVTQFFGDTVQYDIPPLTDGIDITPDGSVSPKTEALTLAAHAWGAQQVWYLTNGASQGNHTICIALRHLGHHLVVARTMHSSVTDAMALTGLTPHHMWPSIDPSRGIIHGVTASQLDQQLHNTPDAVAAWITSPSYFGAVSDIAALADVAHSHNVPLIVDEAWGAHFGFHPDLPVNAARLGADLVVSSTHKLGGSLGQSAMLHLGHGPHSDRLAPHIDRALKVTSSTSESSLLIAGLDLARRHLATRTDTIHTSITAANEIRERLRHDDRYRIATDTFTTNPAVHAVDPLRIVIDTQHTGLTGHEVRHRLFHQHGVHIEMSTDAVIVALIGAGTTPNIDALLHGLNTMPHGTLPPQHHTPLPQPGRRVTNLTDATYADTEIVPRTEAAGRISADTLAAYPPGIPNVLPGELLTPDTINYLTTIAAAPHGHVRGAVNPTVTHYRVLTHTAAQHCLAAGADTTNATPDT